MSRRTSRVWSYSRNHGLIFFIIGLLSVMSVSFCVLFLNVVPALEIDEMNSPLMAQTDREDGSSSRTKQRSIHSSGSNSNSDSHNNKKWPTTGENGLSDLLIMGSSLANITRLSSLLDRRPYAVKKKKKSSIVNEMCETAMSDSAFAWTRLAQEWIVNGLFINRQWRPIRDKLIDYDYGRSLFFGVRLGMMDTLSTVIHSRIDTINDRSKLLSKAEPFHVDTGALPKYETRLISRIAEFSTDSSLSLTNHDNCCYVLEPSEPDTSSLNSQSSTLKSPPQKKKKTDGIITKKPRLTLVINTWRREKCLLRVLQHWSQCQAIDRLVVVSADPETPQRWKSYPILLSLLATHKLFLPISNNDNNDDNSLKNNNNNTIPNEKHHKVPIYLHTSALGSNNLTDRFLFDPLIMTDTLMPIDDDFVYSCELVERMLEVYDRVNRESKSIYRKRNAFLRDRRGNPIAVGLEPRSVRLPYYHQEWAEKLTEGHRFYGYVRPSTGVCVYNAVWLTLGGIIDKQYFEAFQSDRMREIRDLVNSHITAEDIALSLLYSSMNNGLPPLAMVFSPRQITLLPQCMSEQSTEMHSHSSLKRTRIAVEMLRILGFNGNPNHRLQSSSIYLKLI